MTDDSASSRTILEDPEGKLLCWEPGIAQTLLQKGIKVKINQESAVLKGHVVEWYYEATHQSAPRLHIVVNIQREPWFEKLDPELQDGIRFVISLFVLLLVGLTAYVVSVGVMKPLLFWGYIGYYLRWTVLLAIFLVGCLVVGRAKGFLPPRTAWGQTLGIFYSVIMLIMALFWWYVSEPSTPLKVYPDDYAHYVYNLGRQFKQNLILPLISVGWLAGLFKLMGWSGLAGIIELITNMFKKKEQK